MCIQYKEYSNKLQEWTSGSRSGPAQKCFWKFDFCVPRLTVNTQEFVEVVLHHLLAPGE